MSSERDLERAVRTWLRDGLESLPDRYLDAALDEISATNQRRRGPSAWRPSEMNSIVRFALAAAAAALVAVVGWTMLFNGGPHVAGPQPSPSPTSTAVPSAPPGITRHTDTTFVVPFSYDAPTDWTIEAGNVYNTSLQGQPHWGVGWYSGVRLLADPCHPSRGFMTPTVGPMPTDLAVALQKLPGFTVSRPIAYQSPGHSGLMIDMQYRGSASCGSADATFAEADGNKKDVTNPAYQYRWYITELNGKRVVIEAWAAGTPLAAKMTELQRIVDSITFK